MSQTYTVRKGDFLWRIATRFYGDGTKYTVIAAANHIADPNVIQPGMVLVIPDLNPPPPPQPPLPPPERLTFRLLRPADLVDLRCTAAGFTLTTTPPAHPVRTHLVVDGDTLWGLATEFYGDGTKFTIIAAANHIPNPNVIDVGQLLVIPDIDAPTPVVTYTVVDGDTLWDLAAHFYGDPTMYRLIAAANGLADPDVIDVGQVLVIPNAGSEPGGGGNAVLVAATGNAHIVVEFGPQNIYEQSLNPPGTGIAQILAAHESRIVFDVPQGTAIDYSVAGILSALSTFAVRVNPQAVGKGVPVAGSGAPVRPTPDETAIEAPFRLLVSPTPDAAFSHPSGVAGTPGDPNRTELWATRLGRRIVADGHFVRTDLSAERTIRALWTRDDDPSPLEANFGSLSATDRIGIVKQTSDRHGGIGGAAIEPEPLAVKRLQLSTLGAWIDWSGAWDELTYPGGVKAYRHRAPMGRDSYVRIERAGYLYPFGHRVDYVKVTERRLGVGPNPVAYLETIAFVVVRERTRSYDEVHELPFTSVTIDPPVSPNLDPRIDVETNQPFVPHLKPDQPFLWQVTGVDHAGVSTTMHMPLAVVMDAVGQKTDDLPALNADQITGLIRGVLTPALRRTGLGDAEVAFAPSSVKGDTTFRVATLDFDGAHVSSAPPTSTPSINAAFVAVPALEAINGARGPVEVSYTDAYAASGVFTSGEVFLELRKPQTMSFAGGSGSGGGFVEPNVGIAALSRSLGAVGSGALAGGSALSQGQFDPNDFLGDALPKLFGLFSLADIIPRGALSCAPKLITEQLSLLGSVGAEFARLTAALDNAGSELTSAAPQAANDAARQRLLALAAAARNARTQIDGAATPLTTAFGELIAGHTDTAAAAATAFATKLAVVDGVTGDPVLPVATRAALEKPLAALRAITTLAQSPGLIDALRALTLSNVMRFEWSPDIQSYPTNNPVFVPHDGLTIAVEIRTTPDGKPHSDISAQLRGFDLNLIPNAELMRLSFGRIGFRAQSGRKPEVDVVFDKLEFCGVLAFVEKIRQLIPFDGFADPPYVDISTDGVTAGFSLALPSVSVGVFSLENIALSADCRIPFLGDAVTVGFGFCSKESPFRLTVLCIGGGGWLTLRLSPQKMVLLELGLEACASLSIDLGVASGSVSVAVGVYLRLEDSGGKLAAYFRVRGQMDVLGLISASITLELSLSYDFPTGKLVGRASITVEVEVLFFSASVEVSCERRLAGSKGDPALRDVLPPAAGGAQMWNSYFDAFAIGA